MTRALLEQHDSCEGVDYVYKVYVDSEAIENLFNGVYANPLLQEDLINQYRHGLIAYYRVVKYVVKDYGLRRVEEIDGVLANNPSEAYEEFFEQLA